ncbi:hypothetical protein CPB83DRAFT_851636 [Crepidotus variabilis]|uniref:Peptidase M20 dimerisation domain-containing protein n=1 Tax=Crepidotus variabilis TaxID=179855 RepID=A0A9P6EJ33_9AGAR|nr:hypothetical protein CPB83DRAFT_851636 [Crepidotus variabilis]
MNALSFTQLWLALLLSCLWADTSVAVRELQLLESVACPQPSPTTPTSNFTQFLTSPTFVAEATKRLIGAVKIPTMVYDGMGPTNEDPRWAPFKDLHSYLHITFPQIHSQLDLSIVNEYALIYTWRGTNRDLKPLMLTGHLDVVPVDTDLNQWTHPPFAGASDETWIYGRGSSDCKNNVIGIMTSIEQLLSVGWKPKRTIILAFGNDEEIGGVHGATSIAAHLLSEHGNNSIAMIVDEGGSGLDSQYGVDIALPGVAEKGLVNVIINVDMLGGHSSVPPDHTTIGILAKIVARIEDANVFQPQMRLESPIWGQLSCISKYGQPAKVPAWIKSAVQSENPDMNAVAQQFAKQSLDSRYLIQTSKAVTLFHAGIKSNVLAESANATINSRIEFFNSTTETEKVFYDEVLVVAQRHNLRFQGKQVTKSSPTGNITMYISLADEPSPVAPFDGASAAWNAFSKAVQAAFGPQVVTSPSGMTGNTDTRRYWNLTHTIYRWSPTRLGTALNKHAANEMIKIESHIEGIRFYTELIIQLDQRIDL